MGAKGSTSVVLCRGGRLTWSFGVDTHLGFASSQAQHGAPLGCMMLDDRRWSIVQAFTRIPSSGIDEV